MLKRLGRAPQGQNLVETALVMPLFLMVIFGIVVLGIGIFYQQELANAGREAARYAVIHSATRAVPEPSRTATPTPRCCLPQTATPAAMRRRTGGPS